ncbi:MAG: amidohydrolase [Chloroflexi bacterium]|nr:amidohydrolase [Chloroflexota bacterium]
MPPSADILFENVNVTTQDPERATAEAVAVQGGQILFVGSLEEASAFSGAATRRIDGQHGTLLPGLIDSHFHLLTGSLTLEDLLLNSAFDGESLGRAIRVYTERYLEKEWVVGHGLRYNILPGRQPLTRQFLDALLPDKPLILMAYDVHTAWANTAALKRGGLLHGGSGSPNSEVVMAADGTTSGELREGGAYRPILDLIPTPDDAAIDRLLKKGLAQAAALGITSIHNMDGDAVQMARYRSLLENGELSLRVYLPYSVRPEAPAEALQEAADLARQYSGDWLRAGAVKFFMDGVIESYTALMLEDYADRSTRGDANFSAEHFTRMAQEADRLGLQIFVHAIGDAAVRRTLDAYEAVASANGPRDRRHRVEHIEVVHPDDVPRFAELGVIASMQPLHAPERADGWDIWPARVGPERWPFSFAWRTLQQAGARLAFGSDWPVVSQDPLQGIASALNRRAWAAGQPEQCLMLAEALNGYTRAAAYAEFQEDRKGMLKPGYLADLVLLPGDTLATPPEQLAGLRPALTMVDGRIVYES